MSIVRILADAVISSGKKIKFYSEDGSIMTRPKKEVRIFDNQEELEQDIEVETMKVEASVESEEEVSQPDVSVNNEHPTATPATSPSKRGKDKLKEQKMAIKKKAAKKTSNGAIIRTVAGREHDISGYSKVKNASGHTSFDNGDTIAEKLRGKTLDEVYAQASKQLKVTEKELRAKYKHLNAGMQRMNLGNRLRKVINEKAAA